MLCLLGISPLLNDDCVADKEPDFSDGGKAFSTSVSGAFDFKYSIELDQGGFSVLCVSRKPWSELFSFIVPRKCLMQYNYKEIVP